MWQPVGKKIQSWAGANSNGCGNSSVSFNIPAGQMYHMVASGMCFGSGNDCKLYINGNWIQNQTTPGGYNGTVASGWTDYAATAQTLSMTVANFPAGCHYTNARLDIIYWQYP